LCVVTRESYEIQTTVVETLTSFISKELGSIKVMDEFENVHDLPKLKPENIVNNLHR
jgi:acyl-coenzyme A synthetase/AMP-(fatty) acid ligase